MGRTANTAIVVAQLYLPKSADSSELVNHGPYVPFEIFGYRCLTERLGILLSSRYGI